MGSNASYTHAKPAGHNVSPWDISRRVSLPYFQLWHQLPVLDSRQTAMFKLAQVHGGHKMGKAMAFLIRTHRYSMLKRRGYLPEVQG